MKLAEVLSKLTLSIDVEVCLVSEEHHPSSCYEARQIILLCICKLGQIDARNFSADLRVIVENVGGGAKEITELRMTMNTFVMIQHFSQRLPMDVRESRAKVIMLVEFVIFNIGVAGLIQSLALARRLCPGKVPNGVLPSIVRVARRQFQRWSHSRGQMKFKYCIECCEGSMLERIEQED